MLNRKADDMHLVSRCANRARTKTFADVRTISYRERMETSSVLPLLQSSEQIEALPDNTLVLWAHPRLGEDLLTHLSQHQLVSIQHPLSSRS